MKVVAEFRVESIESFSRRSTTSGFPWKRTVSKVPQKK